MEFLKSIVGVLVGFFLGRGVTYFERRRRLRAHWSALDAEVDLCEAQARTYLSDHVSAPVYRLPTVAFTTSFPVLLGDGAVSRAESLALTSFNSMIDQINRALDLATEHRGDAERLRQEVDRIRLKCTHLLEAHGGYEAYVVRARGAVAKHVPKKLRKIGEKGGA